MREQRKLHPPSPSVADCLLLDYNIKAFTPLAVSFCPIGLFERGSHFPSEIKPTNVEPGLFETISRDSWSEHPCHAFHLPGNQDPLHFGNIKIQFNHLQILKPRDLAFSGSWLCLGWDSVESCFCCEVASKGFNSYALGFKVRFSGMSGDVSLEAYRGKIEKRGLVHSGFGSETVQQVEKVSFFEVLFTGEGRLGCKIERRIGVASVVMQIK